MIFAGMQKKDKNKFFTSSLLAWNRTENRREMPWKGEKDPYKIWLSEIILQQTRVDQGLQYYNRFIKTFPTVDQLAAAPEQQVFKLWEGLGYYTRCKNLLSTAKMIVDKMGGKFPSDYESILALKGVGPYTAAAISSFAFNLPHAVVDGNVFRVLSRYFGSETPIDSLAGKKEFTGLANELLDKQKPGAYNQALMDFGATICKPQAPLCNTCILKKTCIAYRDSKQDLLPVKEKTIKKRTRWFYYIEAVYNGKVYVLKRTGRDIWQNLYEFILVETEKPLSIEALKKLLAQKKILPAKYKLIATSAVYKQQLTHQTIQGQFIRVELPGPLKAGLAEFVSQEKLRQLPFPKFIVNYLTDKKLTLNL